MKTRVVLLALLTFATAALAATPLAEIGRGPMPKIDGKLDDAGWQTCAQLFPFIEAEGSGLAKPQTRALVLYTDAALCIAARCDEPRTDRLVAVSKTRDSGVWRDDCIEIFLQRPGDKGFCHIIVNSLGVTYDAKNGSTKWNPALQAAAAKDKGAWSVEVAVAWADLGGKPKAGERWRANVCRERKVGKQLSCWSCTYGKFLKPERFGEWVFTDEAVRLERLDLQPLAPGANRAQVQLRLPGQAVAELSAVGAKPIKTAPGGGKPVDVIYPLGLSPGEAVFEAKCAGRTVWRSAFPAVISPRPELENLTGRIKSLQAIQRKLPKDSPLRKALADALGQGRAAARALRHAIERSIVRARPLDSKQYRKLNSTVAAQARALSLMRWPVWTKNNWLDVGRTELPANIEDVAELRFTTLVNEYESGNVIITNLADEPLRLRVTASDLRWVPGINESTPNLLRNANLDVDKDDDGVPDGWIHGTGARKAYALVDEPGRGKVLAIDCRASDKAFSLRQNLELEAGQRYTVEFSARSERATPTVRVCVINRGWTWSAGAAPVAGSIGWRRVRFSFAAPESAGHQLVIWRPAGGLGKVWLDDFVLAEGVGKDVTLAGSAPRLSVADWQELRGGKTVADALVPLNPAGRLDVPAGESRQVWLTLPARDLPPGRYECNLLAKPLATAALEGSPPAKSVRIEIEVARLRITTHPDFAVYNWDYARDEAAVRDLFDHKVNFFLVTTGMPLPRFDVKGKPEGDMDFTSYDRMLRIKMRYARRAGGQILFAYGIIRGFHRAVSKRYGFEFMDEAWVRAFRWAYGKWLAHLKSLGLRYDDFCVQVWDEASHANVRYVVEGGKLLRAIDPKVRFVMDGAQSLEEVKRMDPYIDVWVPHLHTLLQSEGRDALLRYYKQTGEPVYTYTCSTFMKALSPYAYHRLKPWQAASLGLDGVFYWAYNSWRGDPWDDFDGPIADCGVIYPGAQGPIDSRRWEASREGIEDWQLIRLVQRLGAQAKSGDVQQLVAKAIEEVVAEPGEVERADAYRLLLINAATELAKAKPLEIADVKGRMAGRELTVTFATDRPAVGCLMYRLAGTNEWEWVRLPQGVQHRGRLELPLGARAEWVVLAWDELGRVAVARQAAQ